MSSTERPCVSGRYTTVKVYVASSTTAKGANDQAPSEASIKGNSKPTRKLQTQLTIQDIDIAVATYLESNISATMSHGMGPKPISKNVTKDITATRAIQLYTSPFSAAIRTNEEKLVLTRVRVLHAVLSVNRKAR